MIAGHAGEGGVAETLNNSLFMGSPVAADDGSIAGIVDDHVAAMEGHVASLPAITDYRTKQYMLVRTNALAEIAKFCEAGRAELKGEIKRVKERVEANRRRDIDMLKALKERIREADSVRDSIEGRYSPPFTRELRTELDLAIDELSGLETAWVTGMTPVAISALVRLRRIQEMVGKA